MDRVDLAGADELAHEIAVALSRREIDRRRRAFLAAADLAQIDRLAEPALRRADEDDRLALALEGEEALDRHVVEEADAADGRGSAGCPGRWSRCRGRRCPTRPGSRAPGRPRRCRGCSRRTGPWISGRSGLPKLRLSVIGERPAAHRRDVAPGLGHRLLAALDRIGLAIARRHVGGEREALRPVVHAHDGGVAAGRLHGVAEDQVVVLLPDPALRALVRRADELEERLGVADRGLHAAGVDHRLIQVLAR